MPGCRTKAPPSHARRQATTPVLAVVTVLALAASCSGGSEEPTVGADGAATTASSAIDGGGAAPGSSATDPSAGGATGGGAASVATSSTSASGSASPTTGGASTSGGGAIKLGRGVTDTSISLGFMDASDIGAANRAVGGSSARGDETPRKDYGQPLIDWFNDHGGIAGRKILPVWADVKVTPNNTMAANRQGVCATFTQDHKVFAAQMFTAMMYADVLQCMQTAGSIVFDSQQQYSLDDVAFRRWPVTYAPYSLELNRMMRNYVDTLDKAGFFEKLARIGVLYFRTDGATRAINTTLKPALQARGLSVAAEASFTPTESVDTYAQTQAEAQSAVLRFRAAGITHVLMAIGSPGFLSGPFSSFAEQQGYRPRYAFNTTTTPGVTPGSEPNPQFDRSVLMSWSEGQNGWDALAKTPQLSKCIGMLKEEGHPPPRDGLMGGQFVQYCDYLFFMKAALDGARDFSLGGFAAAVARLAPQQPSQTFVSHLPGGRHDGAESYRMAGYDKGCGCFTYTSAPARIG